MKKDEKNAEILESAQTRDPELPQGAEGAEAKTASVPVGYAPALFEDTSVPAVIDEKDKLRRIAVSPGLQALWGALLPMVGVRPSKADEYAGVFKVAPGPSESEATIYIDIPARPYARGETAPMERVVTLSVKLSHDYRLLGDQYYCVDCEAPTNETRH